MGAFRRAIAFPGGVVAMLSRSARIGFRSVTVVMSIALTILILTVATLPRATVAADNHPLFIRGYVFDNAGHKIAGAAVTVTMYNGATPGVSNATTSSSSPLGYYNLIFNAGEWATGNTVQVVAQYHGGAQGLNDTLTANGAYSYQYENVTLPYEIPQFGSTAGLLVAAGLVGLVAAVVLVWRRKVK